MGSRGYLGESGGGSYTGVVGRSVEGVRMGLGMRNDQMLESARSYGR